MKYVGGKLNYFNVVLLLLSGNFKHEIGYRIYLYFSILSWTPSVNAILQKNNHTFC